MSNAHGAHYHGHDHHGHLHGATADPSPDRRHNHAPVDPPLQSHVHGDSGREHAEELKLLCAAFMDGFRQAADKNSYLRIAGIPFGRTGDDGLSMHLVDAAIVSNWQIGTASPAFGSRELVYLPYPGAMIGLRETMTFTYVSLSSRLDVDLTEILHHQVQHA